MHRWRIINSSGSRGCLFEENCIEPSLQFLFQWPTREGKRFSTSLTIIYKITWVCFLFHNHIFIISINSIFSLCWKWYWFTWDYWAVPNPKNNESRKMIFKPFNPVWPCDYLTQNILTNNASHIDQSFTAINKTIFVEFGEKSINKCYHIPIRTTDVKSSLKSPKVEK
jgi:hypothetical protein